MLDIANDVHLIIAPEYLMAQGGELVNDLSNAQIWPDRNCEMFGLHVQRHFQYDPKRRELRRKILLDRKIGPEQVAEQLIELNFNLKH